MYQLIMALATGFGVGYLPKAPGTWGTLLALPLHFLLILLSPTAYAIALGIIFVLAVFTAGSAEKIIDRKDPQVVVIDEVIGMLIALIGAPPTLAATLLGFVLFRFFDIVKPFPVSFFDKRVNGGMGIVMDDVAAGLMALVVLQIVSRLLGWL